MTEIADIFNLIFNKELTDKIIEEKDKYIEQFLHRHELAGQLLRHGNLWQREEFVLYWACLHLRALFRNLPLCHILPQKVNFYTRVWRQCNKRQSEIDL